MLNVLKQSGDSSDCLTDFMIELLTKEPTFTPGDELQGRIHIRTTESEFTISTLRVTLKGVGNVAAKVKKEEMKSDCCVYLKKDWNIITSAVQIPSKEKSYFFQAILPHTIPTSVQCSKGNIQYTVSSVMEYLTSDGETRIVKAVRGITVVEPLELDQIPKTFIDPRTEADHFKFGWFLCTGGVVRLVLTMERTAFVSGEGIALVGRLENNSDKIIEKAWAVLQRNYRIGDDVGEEEVFTVDVQSVQEDQLAIHVGPHKTIRIDKRISIPPLAPTTLTEVYERPLSKEEPGMFNIRRRSTARKLSVASLKCGQIGCRRLISISYSYVYKVKCGGTDIIEIEFPVVVGSKPLSETIEAIEPTTARSDAFPGAVFKHCRIDKPVTLVDDTIRTLCNKAQLQHLNKYPFYPELRTSSKQGKKLCLAANTVCMETRVLQSLRSPDNACDSVEDHPRVISTQPQISLSYND